MLSGHQRDSASTLISVCVESRKWPLCCWPTQPAERKRGNMHSVVPCRTSASRCVQQCNRQRKRRTRSKTVSQFDVVTVLRGSQTQSFCLFSYLTFDYVRSPLLHLTALSCGRAPESLKDKSNLKEHLRKWKRSFFFFARGFGVSSHSLFFRASSFNGKLKQG